MVKTKQVLLVNRERFLPVFFEIFFFFLLTPISRGAQNRSFLFSLRALKIKRNCFLRLIISINRFKLKVFLVIPQKTTSKLVSTGKLRDFVVLIFKMSEVIFFIFLFFLTFCVNWCDTF